MRTDKNDFKDKSFKGCSENVISITKRKNV